MDPHGDPGEGRCAIEIERTAAPPTTFVHEALLYRDPPAYLAGTVPFIRDGLAAGAPVLVAVPRSNGELVRRELGWQAERVTIVDMTVDGRNPSRIMSGQGFRLKTL